MIIRGKSRRVFSSRPFPETLNLLHYAVILLVLLLLPSALFAASMTDYCVVPPYVRPTAPPNVLLMIDNSASQYDLAYTAGTMAGTTVPTISCNAGVTASESFCFDDTYDDTKTYYGYFQSLDSSGNRVNTTYQYQYSGANAFNVTPGAGGDYFVTSATPVPTTGCYAGNGTGYFCVQGTANVTAFYATGNFLNWLTTSKFDVQKKVLTGGKYDTTNQLLIGETRACNGRRSVKMVKNPPNSDPVTYWPVTFAVRGPNAGEQDYLNSVTQGGLSRVEIYLQAMSSTQIEACQCAIAEWTSGDSSRYGQAKVDTSTCLGTAATAQVQAYNQIMQDCWTIKKNLQNTCPPAGSACQPWGTSGNNPSFNSTETQCAQVYADICGSQSSSGNCSKHGSSGTVSSITAGGYLAAGNDNSGAWQCTSAATHLAPTYPFDIYGTNTTGFVGQCVTSFSWQGNKISPSWDDNCVREEILHYCFGNTVNEVIDPSTATAASTTGNIPAVLMDTSVSSLQKICTNNNANCSSNADCTSSARCVPPGTFFARVSAATAPTGKIQEFKNVINFGAMAFNQDGSNSECCPPGSTPSTCATYNSSIICSNTCSRTNTECLVTSDCNWCSQNHLKHCSVATDCSGSDGSCVSTTDGGTLETCSAPTVKTDGGRVFSYINSDLVGDHTTGLVNSIDNLQAVAWTPFAEAFYSAIGYFAKYGGTYSDPPVLGASRPDMQLNASLHNTYYNYATDKNPSQYPCQDNDVLIVTDGMSTADWATDATSSGNVSPDNLADKYTASTNYGSNYGYDTTNTCPNYGGSRSLPALAWIGQNKVIKDSGLLTGAAPDWTASSNNADHINTLVVYSGRSDHCSTTTSKNCMLNSDCPSGETCVIASGYPAGSYCDPYTLMNKTAYYGGSGAAILASNPTEIENAITTALTRVISRAAAGTAASVLASGAGSGANLVQAVYYPSRIFTDSSGTKTKVGWTGRLSNLWYYSDAFFRKTSTGALLSSIYEDTDPDKVFDQNDDKAINLSYDTTSQQTYAYYTDGSSKPFEQLNVLWEAGKQLWLRNIGTTPRSIYTTIDTGSHNPLARTDFNTTNASTLESYLNAAPSAGNSEANAIITYTSGSDANNSSWGYRSRNYCEGGTCGVWKLGDIIDSTPKIASKVALNTYDSVYGDTSYSDFICSACTQNDTCTSTNCPSLYYKRGLAFAGANDGMLHAFYFGRLTTSWPPSQTSTQLAKLTNDGSGFGEEVWAYIPKNALPYLKYMADQNYCHVYGVDLTSELVDVSVGAPGTGDISGSDTKKTDTTVWRTYLIGGMRFGGACRDASGSCNSGSCSVTTTTSCTADSSCPTGETCVLNDCVKTPVSGLGFSSYFALDVTDSLADPSNPPVPVWEFASPDLGFATTGPAIVREGSGDNNGKWFVVFGSGPTGPIDSSSVQFIGRSDQPLKFFAFDLKLGPGNNNANVKEIPGASIDNAFAGPMALSTVDVPNPSTNIPDYRDDVVYAPYARKCLSTDNAATCPPGTWTGGGIARIITANDTNPENWSWSVVIDGVGPVTTSIGKLLKKKLCYVKTSSTTSPEGCLWLYGGTGRYFYKKTAEMDDRDSERQIFGIKEPCYSSIANGSLCTLSVQPSNITDVTTSWPSATTANSDAFYGWNILLGDSAGNCADKDLDPVACSDPTVFYGAERVVTNTVAAGQGVVFFTSLKPYTGQCPLGGKSFIWAVNYNTGGTPAAAALKGEALLQLSTGAIAKLDLSTIFTDKGGRKTSNATTSLEGIGGGAPTILGAPAAVKKVVHIRER